MAEATKVGVLIGSKEEKAILEAIRRLEKKIDDQFEEHRRWHQLIGKEHYDILKKERTQ